MATYHSRFSASAAHRWFYCPGSIPAIETLPVSDQDTSSEAAKEGTALHAVLEHCLKNDLNASEVKRLEYNDHGKTCTIEPNDEQHEAVQKVLDHIRSFEGAITSETRVTYGYQIGADPKEAFGTSDAFILNGTTVRVYDAKFGRNYVEPAENLQMILYAIGVVDSLEFLGEKIEDIYLHIGQPRVGNMDAEGWHMTRADLTEWIAKFRQAVNDVEKATQSMPAKRNTPEFEAWAERWLVPNDDACRWCPFKPVCPSRRKEFDAMIDAEFSPDMDDEILAHHLALADRMEDYIAAIRSHATDKLAKGGTVTGWKLVKGRAGNRRWASEPDAEKALAGAGLDNAFAKPKLLSPAQAERQLKKLMEKEDLDAFMNSNTVRNAPKPALVKADQPGEPWVSGADLSEFEIGKET